MNVVNIQKTRVPVSGFWKILKHTTSNYNTVRPLTEPKQLNIIMSTIQDR